MTPHEIKPKQLRALLLLLVLLPLIPTVLMVRFVGDLVEIDRASAIERLATGAQQALLKGEMNFAKQIGGLVGIVTAKDVAESYRGVVEKDQEVRVFDEAGQLVAGGGRGPGVVLAQASLRNLSLPWTVEISLVDPAALNAGVKDRVHQYVWPVILAIGAVVLPWLARIIREGS